MAPSSKTQNPPNEIRETPLDKALGERYLSYALSTITSRSLPDVRDGLKPVQRRILYAMKESGNTAERPYRKSASAVGYVMMKYHPHGNDPIYEAMVRMSQDFASRYPLVEGQGNFGSIDGDNAAAMRYTEARLSFYASALLEGIDEDAIDFQPTYNGETVEPTVLPAGFPNLLANGASGIAVGMATHIPPHNLDEICGALLHLIREPKTSIETLLTFMPGPDFPCGGEIIEDPEGILKAYETGRGRFRLRARWSLEKLKRGAYQIVITEIPYQVQKARLVEKIADLWAEKKLPLLGDIRDESTMDVRIVLTPRSSTVDPEMLMESLFRLTELETLFHLNMNVLEEGKIPRVMNLREILQAFLNHRQDVLCRRTRNRLNQIAHRLEVLQGYLIAYLNLDEVIRIVRYEDDPKGILRTRWNLTEIQADAILNMRLKALRKLEEIEIKQEFENLEKEQKTLNDLLEDEKKQWKKVTSEIKEIQKKFGATHALGARRTTFTRAPDLPDIPLEAMIEKEPVTVVCSKMGWIRVLKGHQTNLEDIKYKEGDEARFILHGETTDQLVLFASHGRFYTLGIDKLPGGRGHGEPLRLLIDLENDEDVISILTFSPQKSREQKLLLVASDGRGFVAPFKNVISQKRSGKQVMNLPKRAVAKVCALVEGDGIALVGTHRKLLIFKLDDVPELSRGRGVILQGYRDGQLSDAKTFFFSEGLSWRIGDRTRTETNLLPWIGRRGQTGKMPPVGFPRSNKFD